MDNNDRNDGDEKVVDITPRIKSNNRLTLRSYDMIDTDKGKTLRVGRDAKDIHTSLNRIFPGDWPRQLGGRLFIPPNGKIKWLRKPNDLFGWLSSEEILIDWPSEVTAGLSKGEFHAALLGLVPEHKGFATLPHFPEKPGYYYVPIELPENSDGAFESLLGFFNPATPEDGDILKAAFMTLFWGGPGGARPAFVIMGTEDDDAGGRGIGKTTLTDVMADLAGGSIDFSTKMQDIDTFKKRVLTSNGQRIIRFDNVKTSRLSNGDIESVITASTISGHVMFQGDGALPNDFTYLFTFNDASFSKDMAQRAIPLKLKRPEYSGDWTESVAAFVAENRLKIIAGIRDAFAAKPIVGEGYLRFGQWTKEVLYRATTKGDLAKRIKGFQDEVDDDDDLGEEIAAIITHQLEKYIVCGYGMQSTTPLFQTNEGALIRKTVLNRWIAEGLNMKLSSRAAAKMIARARVPGFIAEHTYNGHHYMVWAPPSFLVTESGDYPSKSDLLARYPGGWLIFEHHKIAQNLSKFAAIKAKPGDSCDQSPAESPDSHQTKAEHNPWDKTSW